MCIYQICEENCMMSTCWTQYYNFYSEIFRVYAISALPIHFIPPSHSFSKNMFIGSSGLLTLCSYHPSWHRVWTQKQRNQISGHNIMHKLVRFWNLLLSSTRWPDQFLHVWLSCHQVHSESLAPRRLDETPHSISDQPDHLTGVNKPSQPHLTATWIISSSVCINKDIPEDI